MKKIAIYASAALILGACAGRAPAPIAVTTSNDANLSCHQMDAEIANNNNKIVSLRCPASGHMGQTEGMI